MLAQERIAHYADVALANYDCRFAVMPVSAPIEHVVLLNNLAAENLPLLRERQEDELIDRLAKIGIGCVGRATAPRTGPSDGVSSAVVFEAPADACDVIEEEWLEVYRTVGWE